MIELKWIIKHHIIQIKITEHFIKSIKATLKEITFYYNEKINKYKLLLIKESLSIKIIINNSNIEKKYNIIIMHY